MTKINRLTVHGFKSFAHKTEIPFDGKFNCVLGPNGSGKSNIGDALCFVLGRLSAKSMRAEKASNLLFNGGKNKSPASQATVEIAFDNRTKSFPEEAPEIVVSRAINKDGSSTYRINGKKKTRTEVLDFLSLAKINPNGYNIILQGDITRFVDMSHLERRQIIEEISDVSLYEEKKHKALLELEKVDEKLNNASIILKERKTHLQELKKDRDQALKFKEAKDTINNHKATHLHLQIKEREEVKAKFDKEIAQRQEEISQSEKKIAVLREDIAQTKAKISEVNKHIEQKGEKEQVQVHRALEDLKVNLAKNKTRISTLKEELHKIQQRKDKLLQELEEVQQKTSSYTQQQKETQQGVAGKQKEVQDLDMSIQQFKKKHHIESSQEIEREIEEKDKIIEKKQEEVNLLRQQQQDLLREKDKAEFQLQSMDERMKKVQAVQKEHQEQIKHLQQKKNDFKQATLRLNQLLDADSSFASQLGNAKSKVASSQEKITQLQAKTASLQAGLAANHAVKSILSLQKKGVLGTLAGLGQVKKQYALALERAAGQKMQHLVVDSDKTAAECIAHLQKNKLGHAAFIPLNKIKYQDLSAEDHRLLKQETAHGTKSGVHDFALKLVSFDARFKAAFAHVFGNTLVVDDLETARRIGIGRVKMAALDGSIAEGSGVMRGGYFSEKNLLGFKEQDALEELEKWNGELEEVQKVIASVQMKREANEQEITALRKKRAELEAEVITLEKTLHLDTADLDASEEARKQFSHQLALAEEKLAGLGKEIALANKELAGAKSRKQILRAEVTSLRDPKLLAQLQAFEAARQKNREELLRLESDLKNMSSNVQQMLAPEQEKVREILKQHEKEERQFQGELKELSGAVEKQEKELTEKEKESTQFYARYRELFNQREKLSTEVTRWENEIELICEKARVHERELNLTSLKNAEVKAKLAGLQEEFSRYPGVQLLEGKTLHHLEEEIRKLEAVLAQMSAVNLKALEIYEQIETEYGKLVEKKDELDTEKTDILAMMNEIETKKKDHFMKTFVKVNDHFQRLFGSLFSKGKASLVLDNLQQPFTDGLSIKVKLTGNRYLDIKSLSGGEKTLTALAFIFSIQEHQPASFYILDEIDAALDKHNSDRLSKLVRSYSDTAQYILISHNDAVIAEADTLFGVSMQDGVSKVTTLRI